MTRIVFKVGGSLLDWGALPHQLRACLALRPEGTICLVVGGGATTDVVRNWDQAHHLSDTQAHELALESMGLNERLLQTLLPELQSVASLAELLQVETSQRWILVRAAQFCASEESHGATPLPRSWDVTSDSVAAWIAGRIQAEELVLLKSVDWQEGMTCQDAIQRGWLDPRFSQIVQPGLRLAWGNGRGTTVDLKQVS